MPKKWRGRTNSKIDRFGIDPAAASGVASNLIPTVLQHVVSKTYDTTDSSFSLGNIAAEDRVN